MGNVKGIYQPIEGALQWPKLSQFEKKIVLDYKRKYEVNMHGFMLM